MCGAKAVCGAAVACDRRSTSEHSRWRRCTVASAPAGMACTSLSFSAAQSKRAWDGKSLKLIIMLWWCTGSSSAMCCASTAHSVDRRPLPWTFPPPSAPGSRFPSSRTSTWHRHFSRSSFAASYPEVEVITIGFLWIQPIKMLYQRKYFMKKLL